MSSQEPIKLESCPFFVNATTGQPIEMVSTFTEDMDVISENVRQNVKRFLPQARPVTQEASEAMILCGGPSINQFEDDILRKLRSGMACFTMNGAYDWVLDRGLTPSAMVIVDARESNNRFIARPRKDVLYLLASQCHPTAFEKLADYNVCIWHALANPMVERKILMDHYMGCCFPIEGGSTVGTRSIMLAAMLGYTELHVYGMDSCFLEGEHHAYNQPENDGDKPARIMCNGREFIVAPWHVSQAIDFVNMAKGPAKDLKLEIYGPGLISHIIRSSADAVAAKMADRTAA